MMKIKLILKRAAALIGVVMMLVFSFVMPISAVDISTSTASTLMQPLFNYNYVEIIYTDGGKACFNIKDVFYRDYGISDDEITYSLSDTYGSGRTITITFSYVDFDQVTYVLNGVSVNLPYWKLGFEMDITDVSSFIIHSGESIYNRDFFGAIYTDHNDSINFYRSDFTSSSELFGFSQSSYFYYPTFEYGSNNQIIGRSLSTFDLSRNLNISSSVPISPYVNINDLVARFPSGVSRYFYYFSETTNTIQVPSDAAYLRFNIHYIPSDNVVSFRQYHDEYFPPYRVDLNATVDFTGWISSALAGFLGFQFAPGITLSTLLLFVLGVAAFNIFLKFFAGG